MKTTAPSQTKDSAPRTDRTLWATVRDALEFIKFSHTIFALPFALVAMLVAAQGLPDVVTVALILVCMVGARTAAMAFNRTVDWEIDQRNPRTAHRSQLASKPVAIALVLIGSAIFVAAAWGLNTLCFVLSPVALLLIFGYSLCKRFTAFSHFFLGLALSAAPMGAWAAVTGSLLDPAPWLLALGVLLWVFGFDLIYALLDADFDRANGLFSFPARFGEAATLRTAPLLHAATLVCLALFGLAAGLGWLYYAGLVLIIPLLVYEHQLAASRDIGAINLAFFNINALVSILLLTTTALDLWIH